MNIIRKREKEQETGEDGMVYRKAGQVHPSWADAELEEGLHSTVLQVSREGKGEEEEGEGEGKGVVTKCSALLLRTPGAEVQMEVTLNITRAYTMSLGRWHNPILCTKKKKKRHEDPRPWKYFAQSHMATQDCIQV